MSIYKLQQLLNESNIEPKLTDEEYSFILNNNIATIAGNIELCNKIDTIVVTLYKLFPNDKAIKALHTKNLLSQIDHTQFNNSFLTAFRGYAYKLVDNQHSVSKVYDTFIKNALFILFKLGKISAPATVQDYLADLLDDTKIDLAALTNTALQLDLDITPLLDEIAKKEL